MRWRILAATALLYAAGEAISGTNRVHPNSGFHPTGTRGSRTNHQQVPYSSAPYMMDDIDGGDYYPPYGAMHSSVYAMSPYGMPPPQYGQYGPMPFPPWAYPCPYHHAGDPYPYHPHGPDPFNPGYGGPYQDPRERFGPGGPRGGFGRASTGDIRSQVASYRDKATRIRRVAELLLAKAGNGSTVALNDLQVDPQHANATSTHPSVHTADSEYLRRHLAPVADSSTGVAPIADLAQHLLMRAREFLSRRRQLLAEIDATAAHHGGQQPYGGGGNAQPINPKAQANLRATVEHAAQGLVPIAKRLDAKLGHLRVEPHGVQNLFNTDGMTKKQRKAYKRAMRNSNYGGSNPMAGSGYGSNNPATGGHYGSFNAQTGAHYGNSNPVTGSHYNNQNPVPGSHYGSPNYGNSNTIGGGPHVQTHNFAQQHKANL